MRTRVHTWRFLLLLGPLFWGSLRCRADEIPHTLALGVTVLGGQIHWGFAPKWALELRYLRGDESSNTSGTVSATAIGLRGYRYFSAPRRLRWFIGMEGATTRSYSGSYDYETSGYAAGAFGGTEIHLMRRLSLGVDVGPYLIASKVRDSEVSDSEVTVVVNAFMNWYFL